MKLLLIEDDEHVAQVLSEAFGSQGHETVVRYTGEEGLSYLTQERPDAVVLDIRLPGLGGVAVLREIRATDPALPVIIMTGLATRGRNRRGAPSRSHRDRRETGGPQALRRSTRPDYPPKSTSGCDVKPASAFLPGLGHQVHRLTKQIVGASR